MALLGGMTITVSACGGSGSTSGGSPTAPTGNSGDTTGAISTNHGHRATITSAELAAGAALTLNIRGDADHPHMVELSAADISRIRSQQTLSKDSSTMGEHMHVVTFSRGNEPTGPGYQARTGPLISALPRAAARRGRGRPRCDAASAR